MPSHDVLLILFTFMISQDTLLPLVLTQSALASQSDIQPGWSWLCDCCLHYLQRGVAVARVLVVLELALLHGGEHLAKWSPFIAIQVSMVSRDDQLMADEKVRASFAAVIDCEPRQHVLTSVASPASFWLTLNRLLT